MFQQTLSRMLFAVDGSVAAMFLDHEGEAVEVVGDLGLSDNLKIIGAYHGIHLNQLRHLTRDLELGTPERFKVDLGRYRVLTSVLDDGYYLVVVLDRHANEGTAWHELSSCRQALLAEL
jgi:hypothetical protein